ncbi:MAG: carbon-nitrogen hydrolase family protein, partial [Candidatus Hodarchaeales archaeon]
ADNNEPVPHIYCVALRNIGLIYYHKNKMEKSIGNLKKAITIHQSLCIARNTLYDFELIVVNWYLLSTSIEINDKNLVENSINELLKIAEKWPWANIFHRAAQALVLKNKKRAKDKIEAQQILSEIVDQRFDYEFEFYIKVNLCELLLDELKFYGEEDVLQEIQKLLSSISGLANNLRSITNLVILYSLEAKLALIEGDAEFSKNMLNKALSLAEDKGMDLLMTKIEYQQNYLMSQLDEWKAMLVKNSSIQEKFEHLNLKKYIENAITIVKNEFIAKQHYELVYVDLLEQQSKIQKRECRVGIAQIGLSSNGNFLAEFYEEISPGFFNLKMDQVEPLRNKIRGVIDEAHLKGINILLFPELSIDLNYDYILEDITNLSKKYEMYIVPGSYHDRESNKNLSVVIAADGILWKQEKHIPATIHFKGNRFQEGIKVSKSPRKTIICNTEYGRIAIVICRDFLDMDLRVELKNVEPPVDIILNPAFTPVTADFQAAHFDARRSIFAYCFFANIAEFGNSLIYTPEKDRKENIVPPKEESIIYKDMDIFYLRSERKKWEIEQKKEKSFIQSTRN